MSDFHSEQINGEFDDVTLAEFIQRFFPFEAGTRLPPGVIILPHSHRAGHLRKCFDKDGRLIVPEEIPAPGRYRPSPAKKKFLKYPVERISSLCFRSRNRNTLEARRGEDGRFTICKTMDRKNTDNHHHRRHRSDIGAWGW